MPHPCRNGRNDGSFLHSRRRRILSRSFPVELGTPNRFEYNILRPYAEAHFPKGKNPLQCHYEMHISMQYGDVPFGPTRWELHTDYVLPGTQNLPYEKQVLSIDALSQRAAKYHIPSLHGSIATFFHRKIATDLYQDGDGIDMFTRVKDKYNGRQLLVCVLFFKRVESQG